jgi:hypothetical protein
MDSNIIENRPVFTVSPWSFNLFIFENLGNFELKNLIKLEYISRFFVEPEFKKFEVTCPRKFIAVKNSVKITEKTRLVFLFPSPPLCYLCRFNVRTFSILWYVGIDPIGI